MENSANSKLFDKLYSKKLENVAIYNTHQFDYPKCSDDNKVESTVTVSSNYRKVCFSMYSNIKLSGNDFCTE